MAKDPYKTLGVSQDASQDEIKKTYKKLAQKYHPDRNPDNKAAEEKFKEISEAYKLVGTKKAREEYEQQKRAQEAFGGQGFSYSFNGQEIDPSMFEELFGGLGGFGGGRSRSFKRKGEDQLFKMEIGFWEAINGAKRQITLPNGKTLEVTIPQGLRTGQKLRFSGQGHPGINGGPHGDLYIEVQVASNPQAQREGDNIILRQKVDVDQAILGGELKVESPLGRFALNLPPYTDNGKKFRIPGKGVKGGDLFVQIELHLPESKKEKLMEALREVQEMA